MLSSLDGRRPFTSTLLEGSGGKVYGDMVVISVRIYSRWFRNIPFFVSLDGKLMKCAVDGRAPEPVIVSEIGTGTIIDYHDHLGRAKWSEKWQCCLLEDSIILALVRPDVMGIICCRLSMRG